MSTCRRSLRSRASLTLLGTVALAASSGCAGLLGLDEFTDGGDGGGSSSGSVASGSDATTTASNASSGSDASSSSSGEGGATSSGAGGAGGSGGGTQCTDPVQCPPPDEACRVAVCEDETCGVAVAEDGDECDGGTCLDGACDVAPGCLNRQLDGNETDVDCGGSCPNCADGLNCDVGGDCVSGYCPNGDDCAACTTHAQCGDGRYCDIPEGVCRDDKANGAPCDVADECTSGNCPGDDGVCCDTPCTDVCDSCGDGTCGPVPAGTDPDDECERTECTTGVCGAGGRCESEPSGTACGSSASCDAGTQTLGDSCNDSGVCIEGGTVDCGNYACNGVECRTTCANNSQCAEGFNCYTSTCDVPICATPPCVLDARGYGGSLDTTATGVAVDPVSLDAFVVGSFSGLLATGGPTSSGNTVDAYLARISAINGGLVFANSLGGPGAQTGGEVIRTQNGNYAVSGAFSTGIDLNGSAGNELTPDGTGQAAAFAAHYDSNGGYLGGQQVGDSNAFYAQRPALVSRGLADQVFVGGNNAGPGSVCGQVPADFGSLQAFLGLLNTFTTCTPGYSFRIPNDGQDEAVFGLAMAGGNALFATGINFDGSLGFGASTVLESSFLARFNSSLTPQWGRQTPIDEPRVAAHANTVSAFLVGWFDETRQFETAAGVYSTLQAQGEDILVARYDGNGNAVWVNHYPVVNDQRALAVAVLPNGDPVVGGRYLGFINFGTSSGGAQIGFSGGDDEDGFVVRYELATGRPIWALRVAGSGPQAVTGLAVLPGGRLVVVGNYGAALSAGSFSLAGAGGTDMFLLRVATDAE